MSSSSTITTSQGDLLKWLNINVVAVIIQTLKCLRMTWTERQYCFSSKSKICEIANCNSSSHFTVSFPGSLSANEMWMFCGNIEANDDDETLALCTLYSRMEGIICVKKYLFFLPQGCLGSYDKYIDFNSFILVCETLFFINNIFSIYCYLQFAIPVQR